MPHTLLTPRTRHTPPAGSELDDIVVEFTTATQALEPLQEAAYRLIGKAACQISQAGESFVCRLTPAKGYAGEPTELRSRFLDLVTDQNLRAKIGRETERTRDLIVALAFGALAADSTDPG